jgi:hypothetical protein
MLLIREGLWSIVSQRLLRPTASSCTGNASNTRASTPGFANDDAATAMNRTSYCYTTIFVYLDERTERCVEAIRNPVQLRAKLKSL